jgi:pimeloyl-ACP methyl ester carboxylesterase
LAYERFGDEGRPAVLLIMGVGAPMSRWPLALCDGLVARGFQVVRYDNRDSGRSEVLHAAGAPDLAAVMARSPAGEASGLAYGLGDLAADAVGLLDSLGLAAAHVAGASMGGMIGQTLAARWPDRVLSLTSIMSTTGNPDLPPISAEVRRLMAEPPPVGEDPRIAALMTSARAGRSPGFPFDEAAARARAHAEAAYGFDLAGRSRQVAAVFGAGDRRAELATITAPTVVVHGDGDGLFTLEHGMDTAATIPGAELRVVPGMGHDLPGEVVPALIEAICAAARASQRAHA